MQENILQLTKARRNLLVLITLVLCPLLGMGIDLIAPSLPIISHQLKISATLSKSLITLFLVGYVIGGFIVGFLSDALGRRKLIMGGLLLFVVASLVPIFFPNVDALLISRFLQGITLSAYSVLARAILSDILPKKQLMRTAVLLATMWTIGPILGPIVGSYLQYYFNWLACFYFYAGYGLIGFTSLLFLLPETHMNQQPINMNKIKNDFLTIIKNKKYIGLVLIMGFMYSSLINFNTLGPFLIQGFFHHSTIYFGHVAFLLGLTSMVGTLICRQIVTKYSALKIIKVCAIIMLLLILMSLSLAYFNSGIMSVLLPTIFMYIGTSLIYPTAMAESLSMYSHLAGSSSSILNLGNILITSASALLLSFITTKSIIPFNWVYVAIAAIVFLLFIFLVSKNKNHREYCNE